MQLEYDFKITFTAPKPPDHIEDLEQWTRGFRGSCDEFAAALEDWLNKQPIIEGAKMTKTKTL